MLEQFACSFSSIPHFQRTEKKKNFCLQTFSPFLLLPMLLYDARAMLNSRPSRSLYFFLFVVLGVCESFKLRLTDENVFRCFEIKLHENFHLNHLHKIYVDSVRPPNLFFPLFSHEKNRVSGRLGL